MPAAANVTPNSASRESRSGRGETKKSLATGWQAAVSSHGTLASEAGSPTTLDTLDGEAVEIRRPTLGQMTSSEWANWAVRRLDSPQFEDAASWRRHCLSLFWPPTCRLCDQSVIAGMEFCGGCFRQLQANRCDSFRLCSRCGRPGSVASFANANAESPAVGCQECRDQKLHFDHCVPVWRYDGLVRQAIVAAKFGHAVTLAETLGTRLGWRLLADETWVRQTALSANAPCWGPELICWVPSHFTRRITRGGGGAQALSRAVHAVLVRRWPELRLVNLLRTTRVVQKQAWLSEWERARNVRNAFAPRQAWLSQLLPIRKVRHRFCRPAGVIAGKHVLVVDDVMTTGATLNEVAAVLKQSGAKQVSVAVAARAV